MAQEPKLSGLPITDVIECRTMEPGILIKTERVRRGWSQAELGKRVSISQVAIKKIETGETVRSKHMPRIAQELGIPLSKLDPSLSQGSINPTDAAEVLRPKQALQLIPGEQLIGEVDLPVYSIVRGGRGALVLENDPFTYTARPKRLVGKKDSYGVLVIGDSMAREYNENDIAYVDPRLHPRKGDPCVFQGTREDGTVEAMIKYLDRSPDASETVYHVSQTNPEKHFTIKKADWQKVHVAVGKESGR
jgi:phage repressor protein C with HTH and peptisase S24 domain